MREFVHHSQPKYVKRCRDLRRPSPNAIIIPHYDVPLECPARKMHGKRHRHNHNHWRRGHPRRPVSLMHVQNTTTLRNRMDDPVPSHIFPPHLLMNEN
jgi:hypothetical protein